MSSKRMCAIEVTDSENNIIRSASLTASEVDEELGGIGNAVATLSELFRNNGETIEVTTYYQKD